MKKAVLILCSLIVLSSCAKTNGKNYILATGGTSGTYYPFGGAIANIWNSNIEGMNVTAQATGASAENLRLVNKGDAEFAIVQNDVMDYAYNGTDIFDGEKLPNIMTIATLYPEVVQIAASKSSGIKTISDMKGKRVSVGDAGSGTEFNAKQIFEAYGLTFNDIKKSNLSFKESSDGLQNGTLDACFITAGVPNAALQELAISSDIALIPLGKTQTEEILKKYAYYTVTTVPAGTYNGINTDVKALAIKSTLAVSSKLDDDTVYEMTKILFEKQSDLAMAHSKGKELDIKYAVEGVSVPFHPGAIKYYEEMGIKVE